MRNIDWATVEARFVDASKVAPPRPLEQPEFTDVPSITPEEVQAMLAIGQRVQIIDTRPRDYSARAHDILDGAVWRDPEHVDEGSASCSRKYL